MSDKSTKEDSELTAQFIFLFYGVKALQEYRSNNDSVPITVYQAVKLFAQEKARLKDAVTEKLTLAARQDKMLLATTKTMPSELIYKEIQYIELDKATVVVEEIFGETK